MRVANRLMFLFLFLFPFFVFGQKSIEQGMKALENKNYGLANNYFRSGIKKSKSIACFGLSKLYSTQDYRNLDSAYFYVQLADRTWAELTDKTKETWKKDFLFDATNIQQHKQIVSQLIFESIKHKPSVFTWNQFISRNEWFHSLNTAVYLRDQLAFELAQEKGTSTALKFFLDTLPESAFAPKALHFFYDLQYKELTADYSLASYVYFYEACPFNSHILEAAKEIYSLTTQNHSLEEYVSFVRTYPSNYFVNDAWRNVYKIYLKDYSEEKYLVFQKDFPDYPFLQELAVDIDLFQMKLYPIISNGKYGFMNAQGKLIIPALYNEVGPFQEGLAVVSKEELFGIIDKKNQVVVDFQFDEILEFVNNRAIVRKENKYGVIDRLGKRIFPLVFDDISLNESGIYDAVKEKKNSMYDLNFQVMPYVNGALTLSFSQSMSKEHPEFEFISELDRTSKRAVVKVSGQLNYIDSTGKLILATPMEWFPDALSVAKFTDGFAVYRKKDKFGLIDLNGKSVQKPVYESSGPFTGFWPVKDKGNWALLDVKGKVVLPFEYDFIRFMPELGYLIGREEHFGLLHANGKLILPVSFSNIKLFENAYFLVSIDEKFGLFLKDGKEILPIQYERIQRFDQDSFVLFQGGLMTYYFPKTHSYITLVE
jgi:hypothetical protein